MNYRKPGLTAALAAEYVLGTLRGPARRRFERVLRIDAGARADVYFWEMRLGEMAPVVPSVAPPQSAWISLRERLERERDIGKVVRLHPLPAPQPFAARYAWRMLAGLAAAAGVVIALLFGQQQQQLQPQQQAAAGPSRISRWVGRHHGPELVQAVQGQEDGPMYVTLLKVPDSNMQWLVSLSADQRQLTVVAAGDYPQAGNDKIQLWWISQKSPPVALGTLPNRSGVSAEIALPKDLANDDNSQFNLAVSLEPDGTSPSELPNGPVLSAARNLWRPNGDMHGI